MFSGESPDRALVEFVELPRDVHPYYVATQAHPEFRSRPHRAHPLFAGPGRAPRWPVSGPSGWSRSSGPASTAAVQRARLRRTDGDACGAHGSRDGDRNAPRRS